ncbi:MAG: hypothetical protein ACREIC_13935 [Limisphaerales bacterium]
MGRIKANSSTPKPANFWQQQAKKAIGEYIRHHQLDVPEIPQPSAVSTETASPKAPSRLLEPHTLTNAFESWKRTWAVAKGTQDTREAHLQRV